jgi:hypothetical protein
MADLDHISEFVGSVSHFHDTTHYLLRNVQLDIIIRALTKNDNMLRVSALTWNMGI